MNMIKAEKHVLHNLLRLQSIMNQMFFYCEIFTDFYEVSVRINYILLAIFQD